MYVKGLSSYCMLYVLCIICIYFIYYYYFWPYLHNIFKMHLSMVPSLFLFCCCCIYLYVLYLYDLFHILLLLLQTYGFMECIYVHISIRHFKSVRIIDDCLAISELLLICKAIQSAVILHRSIQPLVENNCPPLIYFKSQRSCKNNEENKPVRKNIIIN